MEARVEMAVKPEDVRVAAKPQGRSFTAEYTRRLLKEADVHHARAVGVCSGGRGCTPRIWGSGVEPGRVANSPP